MLVKLRHQGREFCQHLSGYGGLVWRHSAIRERLRQGDVPQGTAVADMDTTEQSTAVRREDGDPPARERMEGMGNDKRIQRTMRR